MKRVVIFAICFLFLVSFASAAIYYVSPTGTASWSSCTNINTPCSLTTANTNAQAGDVVYLRGGDYGSQVLQPSNSGSLNNVITFQYYSADAPVEAAFHKGGVYSSRHPSVIINGQSYIVIDGLSFTDPGKTNYGTGGDIYVYGGSSYIEIKNCYFTGNVGWRVLDLVGANYNYIHDNTFGPQGVAPAEDQEMFDIVLSQASYNRIIDNDHSEGGGHAFIHFFSGCNYNVVRGETMTISDYFDTDPSFLDAFVSAQGPGTQYALIENIVMTQVGGPWSPTNTHGVGFEMNGIQYVIMRHNIGNNIEGQPLAMWDNRGSQNQYNTFYSNSFYDVSKNNDLLGALDLSTQNTQETRDNKVVNNIVHTTLYTGILIGENSDCSLLHDNEFRANLLYNIGGEDVILCGGNGYTIAQVEAASPYANGDTFKCKSGISPCNPTTNPLFVSDGSDFHLQPTSPAIDRGDWLTTITSSTGSGKTSFSVDDASYFYDGWGIPGETGDVIKTQNGQTTIIQSIDYNTNTITVSPAISIVNGEGLALDYTGTKPDIGAIEYTATGTCTENWQCTNWSVWSSCVNNQQTRTRTCTDLNSCGTTINKPNETEIQACSSSANSYTILKTSTPPTIDGNLNEFTNANPITITDSYGNSGTYKFLWDSNALYVAADVSDSQLNVNLSHQEDSPLYSDDTLEMFLDTLNNGGTSLQPDDYKFYVNINNVHSDSHDSDTSWDSGMTSAAIATGTINNNADADSGYTIEARIPWANFATPLDDSVWGFDVSMDDRSDTGTIQTAWSNSDGGGFNDPDGWGDVLFSSEFVSSGSICGNAADTNSDGVISITELINYIGVWKSGGATISQLINSIGLWKSGC